MHDGLCPKCYREMKDGEMVICDWAGNATSHINCSDNRILTDEDEAEAFDRAIEFEEALEILRSQG